MIQSMTGYGAAQVADNDLSYALELRSVNNRYLKLSIKVPEPLDFLEPLMERLLRAKISRGTVECTLRVRADKRGTDCVINTAAIQYYVTQLSQVKLPDRIQPTIDLAAIAQLPGVTDSADPDPTQQQHQKQVVEKLLGAALRALSDMRTEEGKALLADLRGSCNAIRQRLDAVAERAPGVIDEYHSRLKTRVAALMQTSQLQLESETLMREVAVFAERCDISEELSRLRSHLGQFDELCERGDQVGRTLDFLTQELLREANTIASKSNDAAIARNIVEVKGLIDRLREQVQNVE